MSKNLEDVIKINIKSHFENVYTSLPARIVSYNATLTKAVVEPTIKTVLADGREFPLPPILAVPVIFPSSNNSLISYPLNKGDEVLLLFTQKFIIDYLEADENKPINPSDFRVFDIDDAVAIPGLFGFKRTPNNPDKHTLSHSTDDLVVKHNLGTSNENELRLKASGNIEISAGSTKITVSKDGGITMSTTGDVVVSGGDVIADGISLKTHTHTQPDTGQNATVQGDTGVPQ